MFKKLLMFFVLPPLILSLLISLVFGFVLIDGDASANDQASVLGLPECIREEMIVAALNCQEEYGYPASVTLAQIIQESSGKNAGLSNLAYKYKNLFGLKAGSSWQGKTCNLSTKEQKYDGSYYTIISTFRAYDSFTESIKDRCELLKKSSYYPVDGVNDPKEFAKCLKKWATDLDYAETLISIMDKYNLYKYDNMTVDQYKQSLTSLGSLNGNSIVDKAKSKLGCKYKYGASHSIEAIHDPDTKLFDCSSFVCWAYYQAGIDIGIKSTKELIHEGIQVNESGLSPGDIILFSKKQNGSTPSHVAIYIGGGQMIHAPHSGDVVKIVDYSDYWYERTLCFRRLY